MLQDDKNNDRFSPARLTLDSVNKGIRSVPVDEELMRHSRVVWRHSCTKAKDREELVCVIVLYNLNNRGDGADVLVGRRWVQEVKGLW